MPGAPLFSDTVRDQTRLPAAVNNPLYREGAMSAKATTATLIVPGIPDDYNVFEITPAGLRPLRHQRVTGGTAIAIEDFLLTSSVLITNDIGGGKFSPAADQTNRRRGQQNWQRELTALLRDQASAVDNRLTDHTQYPAATTALATAGAGLQNADQFLAAADAAQSANPLQAADLYAKAYLAARNAAFPIEHWETRRVGALRPRAAIACYQPVGRRFRHTARANSFAAANTGPPPGENLLVGGDCEELQTMLQAGWRHAEHARPDLQTSVELSPLAPFGRSALFALQVQPVKQQTETMLAGQLVESPPLWVTSAPSAFCKPATLSVYEVRCAFRNALSAAWMV